MVGGTGLYLRALVHGLAELPPVRPAIVEKLREQLARGGVEALYAQLRQLDPALAARIQPRDRQRISRGLGVFYETGVPLSIHQAQHGFRERRYPTLTLAIDWPREQLYERIEARVEALMDEGFPGEVAALLERGLCPELRPMRSLGYREMLRHLRGEMDREATVAAIAQGHRRYAKRQLTWFRKLPGLVWLPPARALETARATVERFLAQGQAR